VCPQLCSATGSDGLPNRRPKSMNPAQIGILTVLRLRKTNGVRASLVSIGSVISNCAQKAARLANAAKPRATLSPLQDGQRQRFSVPNGQKEAPTQLMLSPRPSHTLKAEAAKVPNKWFMSSLMGYQTASPRLRKQRLSFGKLHDLHLFWLEKVLR